MPVIEMTLENDREIWADTCLVAETLLRASDENDLDRACCYPIHPNKVYAGYPYTVIPPELEQDGDFYRLPPFRLMARFDSTTIDDVHEASALVVLWFQQSSYPFVCEDVRAAFNDIEWEAKAFAGNW